MKAKSVAKYHHRVTESTEEDRLFMARRFRYRVNVEIGASELKDGGGLKIREVWGTRPKIEIGGQYLVRGTYDLPRDGTLYFYETATGNWNNTGATLDLQTMELPKGKGEFTLVHGMAGEGWFHLNLTARDRYSDSFANVYFGTEGNVLRNKPWLRGRLQPGNRPAEAPESGGS